MKEQIGKLRALAEMVRDAELARLKQLQDSHRAAQQSLEMLHQSRRDMQANSTCDPAHLAGAPEHWLDWAALQGRNLQLQRAQPAANAEAQIVRARRALGRSDVLGRLGDQAEEPGR